MKGKRVFRFDLIDFHDHETGTLVFSSNDINEVKRVAKRYVTVVGADKSELAVADWDKFEVKRL